MDKIALSIKAAVEASGGAVSRTGLYAAIKAGELELRHRGKRSFLLADDFKRWLENMPKASEKRAA
jgi:hypothetical protein